MNRDRVKLVALGVLGAVIFGGGLGLLLAVLPGCGGSPYTPADQASDVNTVKLASGCELLCLNDAGCTPDQAAACFDAISCNAGSSLHRHGGPDLVVGDAGCR